MHKNHYEGVLDGWKNDLIIGRARRAGLRGDLLLEAQQEIILHVVAFEHDADRANGASEVTALTAVIDHRLTTFRRAISRHEAHQKRAHQLRPCHENERSDLEERLLVIDVRDAISRLTPEEQQVCALLSQGASVAVITQEMQCHWQTVHRIMKSVREKFRDLGLDGWVS